jgi:hypothetical protein
MTRTGTEATLEKLRKLAENARTGLSEILPYTTAEEAEVRAAAIPLLWNFPTTETLDTLAQLLQNDSAAEVRQVAAATLGVYVWSGMQLDEGLSEQFGFQEAISSRDVEKARALLQATWARTEEEIGVRLHALSALAWDADAATHETIGQLWEAGKGTHRLFALQCMGRTGHARWRPTILGALGSGERDVLLRAIEAAGEGCVEDAEKRLLELAQGSDGELALKAIWSLRNVIHTTPGRKALEKLGRSKDPTIKQMAKAALEDLDALDVQERPDDDGDD